MSCKGANADVIDLGTRLAIYSYAASSAALGLVTLWGTRRESRCEVMDAHAYTKKIVQHIRDVNFVVGTSTLTGVALIIAALFHQHYFHALTLFHAYIVLLLLWVITLTGMWFVVHAWVCDILMTDIWSGVIKTCIWNWNFWKWVAWESKWFIVQFSFMGFYGLYVTTRGADFQPPECIPWAFKDRVFNLVVYSFAVVPMVNSFMLFIFISVPVLVASMIVTIGSRMSRRRSGDVDPWPVVFCYLWLLEYVLIIGSMVTIIELLLKENTENDNSPSSFGSTMAVALAIVPLQLVVERGLNIGKTNSNKMHDCDLPSGQNRNPAVRATEETPFSAWPWHQWLYAYIPNGHIHDH